MLRIFKAEQPSQPIHTAGDHKLFSSFNDLRNYLKDIKNDPRLSDILEKSLILETPYERYTVSSRLDNRTLDTPSDEITGQNMTFTHERTWLDIKRNKISQENFIKRLWCDITYCFFSERIAIIKEDLGIPDKVRTKMDFSSFN